MADFGEVLKALKNGKTAERPTWKRNGIYIFLIPEKKEDDIIYEAFIARKTSRGTVVSYARSQQDILAEDWIIKE